MDERDYLDKFDEDDSEFIDWIANLFHEVQYFTLTKKILDTEFNIRFRKDRDSGEDQFGNLWVNKENPEPKELRVIDLCLDEYNKKKEKNA